MYCSSCNYVEEYLSICNIRECTAVVVIGGYFSNCNIRVGTVVVVIMLVGTSVTVIYG